MCGGNTGVPLGVLESVLGTGSLLESRFIKRWLSRWCCLAWGWRQSVSRESSRSDQTRLQLPKLLLPKAASGGPETRFGRDPPQRVGHRVNRAGAITFRNGSGPAR